MKEKLILPYVIMIFLVPLAGEFQFYPLPADFRVSFATPVFLLLLLYFKKVNTPLAGLLVGVSVILLRVILGFLSGEELADAISFHLPVLGYYVTYGVLFHFIPIKNYSKKPLFIGLFACLLELSSSAVELTARFTAHDIVISSSLVITVVLAAIIRSFFVMGFYLLILYHDLQTREKEQRKKNDNILLVISDLYVELIQLRKSINTSESTTSECFYLSRKLQKEGNKEVSKKLLQISGKMHECKKDGQRIYSSLSNLINRQEFKEWLTLNEILDLVLRTNKSYASFLKKDIDFEAVINCRPVKFHSYFLLSILNNLIANSIEAMNGKGHIKIKVENAREPGYLNFSITDNGSGIGKHNQEFIFSPGFTTKYNASGEASNGIGLSYIKNVIESHNGSIELVRSVPGVATEFNFKIPKKLNFKEGEL